jgi:Calcium-activated chloride channel
MQTSTGFILNEVQALKLLLSIIIARPETENGAGLNLDHLQVKGKIKRWFPTHSTYGKERLVASWRGCNLPWNLPLGKIREYLGEKVAYYFGFLSHTTKWMLFPAVIGTAVFVHQLIIGSLNTNYLPAYGIFMALWSSFFIEAWNRQSNKLAQKFGTMDFQASEPLRPEYTLKAKRIRSYVDGKPTYFVEPLPATVRRTISGSATLTLLGAGIAIIFSIFFVRVLLINQTKTKGGKLPDGSPDYITSVINAVVIQLMNFAYTWLAKFFNSIERHPTKSAYDNALTLKLAVFTAINSYFPLLYIAAIKNHITINGQPQQCQLNTIGQPDCMYELRIQLGILIASKIGLSLFLTFILPILWRWLALRCIRCRNASTPEKFQAYKTWKAAIKASIFESQSELAPYDPFDDYLEILLLFGYSTLFVVALPIAPLAVLLALTLNVYVDRQRPMPEPANSIGSWAWVFEAASYISVISNLLVCVFTNSGPVFAQNWDNFQRLVFFVVAEHCVLLLKWGISRYISDVDFMTQLQVDRQKYLVNKHIFGVKDLVITKAEAEASGQVASSASDGDGSAGAGAGGGASAGDRPDSSYRNKIRFAKSWFAMTGATDPRGPEGGATTVAGNAFRDAAGSPVTSKSVVTASPASVASASTDPTGVQMLPIPSPTPMGVAAAATGGAVPVPLGGGSGYESAGGAGAYGGVPVAYGGMYPTGGGYPAAGYPAGYAGAGGQTGV